MNKKEKEEKKEKKSIVQVSAQEMTIDDMVIQVNKIKELYKKVMIENHHYGVIPGCGDKPTLLKPGSEKIMLMLKLAPKVEKEEIKEMEKGHRDYNFTIGLYHRITNEFWGEGTGSCSTMESKYRYRVSKRKCPNCNQDSIIKGSAQYGGGFVCWKKKGGCGSKFDDNDKQILDQPLGRIENPDIADSYNTVKKMGYKRALVSAVLSGTGVSDIFTQDIEESNVNGKEDNATISIKDQLQKEIIAILKKMGIDSAKTAKEKTGVASLSATPIEKLNEIKHRLIAELKVIDGEWESPVEEKDTMPEEKKPDK